MVQSNFDCHHFLPPLGISDTLLYNDYLHPNARTSDAQLPEAEARRLTILLLLVFYICFLPFHILRVIRIESRLLSISCSTEHQIHEAYIV